MKDTPQSKPNLPNAQPNQRLELSASQLRIFPNPVRESATLTYDLAQPSPVRLEILDGQGRLLQTLAEGRQDAGRQQVRFEAPALPGVYFIRLISGGRMQTERFVVVR